MSLPHNTNESWKPCPPGYLQRYASQEKLLLRKTIVTKACVATLLLTVIGLAANYSYRTLSGTSVHSANEHACSEVIPLISDYLKWNLDEDETEKIRLHLEHCFMCRERVKNAQNPANADILGAQTGCTPATGGCHAHEQSAPAPIVNR